jgi:hypothetical protein
MALADIYQKATLVQIPSGYKAADAELYSVVPNTTAGDFTVSVAAGATRVNKDGLIETVSANVPRLNYDPTNPQDPTLLLEPTRTNECLYSKTLSSWTELNGGSLQTITNNDAVAPDGSLTASTITFTGTGTSLLRQFTNKAYTSNKHSSSFYAKKISGNGSVFFGITDTETEFTPTDEWVRYEVNNVTPTDFGTNLFLDLNFDCSAGDKIAVWGMQLEEGTYSTSIVKTAGSAVTRTVDDFQNNFTGLTSTAGTVFLDFETKGLDNNFARLFAVHDSVTSDGIYLGIYSTNTIGFFGIDGGAGLPDVKDTISFNQRNKLVLTFDGSGNYKYSLNGSLQTGTYTGTSRQYDEIGRGNVIGGSSNNIVINQFMVFNEALTDSELQTLTS